MDHVHRDAIVLLRERSRGGVGNVARRRSIISAALHMLGLNGRLMSAKCVRPRSKGQITSNAETIAEGCQKPDHEVHCGFRDDGAGHQLDTVRAIIGIGSSSQPKLQAVRCIRDQLLRTAYRRRESGCAFPLGAGHRRVQGWRTLGTLKKMIAVPWTIDTPSRTSRRRRRCPDLLGSRACTGLSRRSSGRSKMSG